MARFYANENIAQPVVKELRRLGHDVLTSMEAGRANSSVPDSEVLGFAAAEGRILLSHNRLHFIRLHHLWTKGHAGIVLCTVDPDFRSLAQHINTALAAKPDMSNQLVRINRPS